VLLMMVLGSVGIRKNVVVVGGDKVIVVVGGGGDCGCRREKRIIQENEHDDSVACKSRGYFRSFTQTFDDSATHLTT